MGVLDAVDQAIIEGADMLGEALIEAASNGHGQIVEFLLRHGADKLFTDKQGRTAFDCAKSHGHFALARSLRAK